MTNQHEAPNKPWYAITWPPFWLYPLIPLVLAGTGVWQAISSSGAGAGSVLRAALWPGSVIALVVFVVAWLGWALDLE